MSASFSEEFYSSLSDLTSNRRPLIDMLTMLAEDYYASAPSIVTTIEYHLTHVVGDKLATLYLIDSIVKNVGRDYVHLFARNLPTLFTMVFSQADAKTKTSLHKLRVTWGGVFPPDKLLILDSLVHDIDPGWPVSLPPQSTNIHINPDFIKSGSGRRAAVKGDLMKERILQEKKVLLELQKKKVELELLQTKEVLEKEQKKLESYTTTREGKAPAIVPDQKSLPSVVEKTQLTSSSRDVDTEKNKKLLELSIRDPRRKSRQNDVASNSPLSGTSSPIPVRSLKIPEPGSSSSSPNMDFSDESRERPPKKKSRYKDKKDRKEKDSIRERKIYKPKAADSSKNNNGLSYETSITNNMEFENSESVAEKTFTFPSDNDKKLPEDIYKVEKNVSEPMEESRKSYPEIASASSSFKSSSDSLLKSNIVEPSNKNMSDNVEISKLNSDNDIKQSVESSLSELFETGNPTVISRDPRLVDCSKIHTVKQQVGSSISVPIDHDDRLPNTSNLLHSLPHSDLSKSSNSTDSSDVNALSANSQKSDLISNLSNTLSSERKDPIEISNSPSSHGGNILETSDVRSIDSNTLFDELKNSDEDSGSDFISKMTASKRKCDSEDDKDNHKKILLSQLEGEDSPNETQSSVVSSVVYPENKPADLHHNTNISSATLPLIAPPPPTIPPLVPKSDPSSVESSSEPPKGAEIDFNPKESKSLPHSSLVNSEETVKDVDLRLLLPRPIEIVKEEVKLETSSSDVEPITLFGGEDVDYRQKPPQAEFNLPSPPPPPVIGNLHEAATKKSWAQIKDRKSEERFSSPKILKTEETFQSPKFKPDRSKRSSSHSRSNISNKEISRQNSQEHCNLLIKDAEEQLRNGNITFVEYNKMLQEVVSINEERILKEARARYSNTPVSPECESELVTPTSENDSSFESDISHRPEETKIMPQQIDSKLIEPSADVRRSETPDDRFKSQSVEKRFTEPPPVSSIQPQFPRDIPFREDLERDRFDFPDRRVFLPGQGGPPRLNVTNNFPLPQGLGRGMPLPQFPLFPPNVPFQANFRPRMTRDIAPRTLLPPVDIKLLMEAENNRMETITIGGSPKQIRFYGMTAVVLQSWDDPREVCFPPEKRRLLVDQRHEFVLQFGDPPTEIMIEGMSSLVKLGAPNREIYIDNKYYSMSFGGIPFEVLICGRIRSICLPGPPPVVSFSPLKRTDLVAGTVNLYINAKSSISFFLDATPQKFYIEREPCVLQFADSLLTVLINGIPVPLEFGGFPVPVMVRGVLHFLRLTCLPIGIIPGRISIANMISFVQPSSTLPPLPIPPMVESTPAPPIFQPPQAPPPLVPQQPLDLLANIISSPAITSSPEDRSYTAEQPPTATVPIVSEDSQPSSVTSDLPLNININDLLQRLIKNGMLPNHPEEKPLKEVTVVETEVDFSKPDSLKLARPSLVTKLYSGIQCSSCGVRFPPEGTKMYSRHLDWHFRQNRREKHSTRKPQSRNWYYSFSNWLQYQELDDDDDNEPDNMEEEIDEDSDEDIPSVPVGRRKNVACQVCGETFEEFFDHETEEWQARNAIMVEELFYHPLCYEEFKAKKEAGPVDPDEKLEYEEDGPPLDDPITVEVIDLDDTEVPSPVSSHDGESLPLLETEKVESPDVIAVDDTSDSKSSINEVKVDETKEEDKAGSEDDDILAIIPLVRKIDTYDLIDDDDDEKTEKVDETINIDDSKTDPGQEDKEEDFDFTKVTIKQEKDRLVLENVDSSLPTYTATIDGNIIHESAVQPIVPGRIKINIHRSKQTDGDTIEPMSDSNDGIALNEPLPPGEETVQPPVTVKPKLMGVEFTPQPSVNQGSELSGLCSIM